MDSGSRSFKVDDYLRSLGEEDTEWLGELLQNSVPYSNLDVQGSLGLRSHLLKRRGSKNMASESHMLNVDSIIWCVYGQIS